MNSTYRVQTINRNRFKFRQVAFSILSFVLLSFLWVGCSKDNPTPPLIVKHTVTFVTNGGSPVLPKTVDNGKKVDKPATNPTKANSFFDGWYSDANFTTKYDFEKVVTANITLYAKWIEKPTALTISAPEGATTSAGLTELVVSKTVQLTISITPTDADTKVTWSIKDNDATHSKGTISATGVYGAPATMPTPAQVTIKATSVADTNITKEFVVTITDLVTIPGANFRAKLKTKLPVSAFVGDKLKVTDPSVTGLTNLDVSVSHIADLTGIEYFTALINLRCSDNQLTSLDLSKNIALIKLYCYRNSLTSLDLSKNIALIGLNCTSNALTKLDIRGMRTVNFLSIVTFWDAIATVNPLTDGVKVHVNIKDNDKLKALKERGRNVTIQTYTAPAGSTNYTKVSDNYTPVP